MLANSSSMRGGTLRCKLIAPQQGVGLQDAKFSFCISYPSFKNWNTPPMKIFQYGELVSLARWMEAACAVQHEKNECQLGPPEHLSMCSGTVETFPLKWKICCCTLPDNVSTRYGHPDLSYFLNNVSSKWFCFLATFKIILINILINLCVCVCSICMQWYTCGGQRTTCISL